MTITSEQVVAARQRLKLSRKAMAERTGLTESRIWHIEHGKRVPDADDITALARVLDLDSLPHPSTLVAPAVTRPAPVPRSTPAASTLVAPEPAPVLLGDLATSLPLIPTRGARPEPQEGVRLVSNSEVRTFKECRRRWWLGWFRRLRPRIGESALGPAAIGGRIHNALRYWYVPDGEPRIDPRHALELLIVHDWTALTQGGETSLEFRHKFDQEANLERAMIAGYVDWLAETGEDADLEIIAPETYLEAPLSDEVKLIGKLDVRARRRSDGIRVFLDHKTVGDLVSPVKTLVLDEQMLHYHLLEWLNTDEAETRCAGAYYNMLRKSKRTQRANPPFYQRVAVFHNETTLTSYRTRLEGVVTDMLDVEEALRDGEDPRRVAYPTPTRDCPWKCRFVQVCSMFDDGSRAEDMLTTYFEEGDTLSYYRNEDVPSEASE